MLWEPANDSTPQGFRNGGSTIICAGKHSVVADSFRSEQLGIAQLYSSLVKGVKQDQAAEKGKNWHLKTRRCNVQYKHLLYVYVHFKAWYIGAFFLQEQVFKIPAWITLNLHYGSQGLWSLELQGHQEREDIAAENGKVLRWSVWSLCSQGQSWNGQEQIIVADHWNRCFSLRQSSKEKPSCKMCWDVRTVGAAPAWYLIMTSLHFEDTHSNCAQLQHLTTEHIYLWWCPAPLTTGKFIVLVFNFSLWRGQRMI